MRNRHIARGLGALALLGAAAALAGCVAPYGPGYRHAGYGAGYDTAHQDHGHPQGYAQRGENDRHADDHHQDNRRQEAGQQDYRQPHSDDQADHNDQGGGYR